MVKLIACAGLTIVTVLAGSSPKWKADLSPQGGSKISGHATVESRGTDSVAMTISIHGGEINSSYAWHLHQGACGANGQIQGMETAYPELKTSESGSAETSVTLPIAPPTSGVYSVNVHPQASGYKDADSSKKLTAAVVACGQLKPAGDQPDSQ